MWKGFLALLLFVLFVPHVWAQSPGASSLGGIEEAYRQLDYEEAERMARRALGNFSSYTVEQLTQIHTILGLIAYNQRDLVESRRQFLSALQLAPDLELDPVLVSPKIQDFFAGLRSEEVSGGPDASQAATRYLLVRDPRTDGALRSALLPGWGQFYKGHHVKGYVFSGLVTGGVGGAVLAHDMEEYRLRNRIVGVTAAVWILSYIDALLSPPERLPSASLSMRATPSSVSFSMRF